MDGHAPDLLSAWEAFYVIVGSSAAALTGLQFVVIALVAERRGSSTPREIAAFGTPTVVHFGAVLLLSANLGAPWPSPTGAAVVVGACGLAGLLYTILVVQRARRQQGYRPVLEDWIWHGALPLLAHAVLLAAALLLRGNPGRSLFAIAAAAVLLLFVGIHNAWDTVTYVVTDPGERKSS